MIAQVRRFFARVPFVVIALLLASGTAFAAERIMSDDRSTQATSGKPQVIKLTDRMSPDAVKVAVGQTVMIGPADGRAHVLGVGKGSKGAATEANDHDHKAGSEIPLKRDEAYQIKFDKPGIYYYHDHDNPDANVAIVVTAQPL